MGRAFFLLWTSLLGACTSVQPGDMSGAITHHFGYVRIQHPDIGQGLSVEQVDTIGLQVDPSLSLGRIASLRIEGDPARCALIILIKDKEELAHVETMLSSLGREDLCATSLR